MPTDECIQGRGEGRGGEEMEGGTEREEEVVKRTGRKGLKRGKQIGSGDMNGWKGLMAAEEVMEG